MADDPTPPQDPIPNYERRPSGWSLAGKIALAGALITVSSCGTCLFVYPGATYGREPDSTILTIAVIGFFAAAVLLLVGWIIALHRAERDQPPPPP